jgi:hypothetical protein
MYVYDYITIVQQQAEVKENITGLNLAAINLTTFQMTKLTL